MSALPESGGSLRAAIIGNRGKMGKLFTSRFALAGHKVTGAARIARPDGSKELDREQLSSALRGASLVLLCVPAPSLPETLRAVVPLLNPDQTLMDITSVKVEPMRIMETGFSGPVIGTHPLFGSRPKPEDLRVALVRGQRANAAQCLAAENLFAGMGCQTFWTSAEEHDWGAGIAQSLNFAVDAAYVAALARFGDRRFLTPSCRRHLEAARKSLTEDADMFCAFTAQNPHFQTLIERYEAVFHETAGKLPNLAREAAAWYDKP